MPDQPQSDLPPLVDADTFILYCWTCAHNTAGTLYSLIWCLLAGKVELKRRLHARSEECLAWQSEVISLRERLGVAERAIAPLRYRVATQGKIIKELERKIKS